MNEKTKILDENDNWIVKTNGSFFNSYIESQGKKDIEKIRDETKYILSQCGDPNIITKTNFDHTGLVVGKIQSGKTSSMEALSAMAKDNGYKLIIVLSGITENLADQTRERFEKSLNIFGYFHTKITGDKQDTYSDAQTMIKKFETWDKNSTYEEGDEQTVIIVSMKNTYRINKIAEIIQYAKDAGVDFKKIPTLIIDDEGDQHSPNNTVNLKQEKMRELAEQNQDIYEVKQGDIIESIAEDFNIDENLLKKINKITNSISVGDKLITEPPASATNREIKKLRKLCEHHSFLSYTATPQGLLLIDLMDTLSANFIKVLDIGSDYRGGKYYFDDNDKNKKHIKNIDQKELDDLSNHNKRPPSLDEAIRIFIIGAAIGYHFKEHRDTNKNRSMMVHPDISQNSHLKFLKFINAVLDNSINALNDDVYKKEELIKYQEAYNILKKYSNNELPGFTELNIPRTLGLMEKPIELNSRINSIEPVDWKNGYARIIVGGVGIERGFTIEGLTVSYLCRGLGTRQSDTLQQQARFFGYHARYEDLIQIFMTKDHQDFFKKYVKMEENLLDDIEKFSKSGKNAKEMSRRFFLDSNYRLTRKYIFRANVDTFNKDYARQAHSHKINNPDLLNENRTTYLTLDKNNTCTNLLEPSNFRNFKWKSEDKIILNIGLEEAFEKIIKKIRSHPNDITNYNNIIMLIENYLERNKEEKDIICPIIIMNRNFRKERSLTGNKSKEIVNIWQGPSTKFREAGITSTEHFPGDRYLHYEFLTGDTLGTKPIKYPTLQAYLLNIKVNKSDNDFKWKERAFFNFYIPKTFLDTALRTVTSWD